jgi:hypothetical protein
MSRKLVVELAGSCCGVAAVADRCHEALAPTRNFPEEPLLVRVFQ